MSPDLAKKTQSIRFEKELKGLHKLKFVSYLWDMKNNSKSSSYVRNA